MWKDSNEEGFYSFDSAIAVFNNSLPSKEEMEELVNTCKSEWDGANYKITGPNKNYIILPEPVALLMVRTLMPIRYVYKDVLNINPSSTIADMIAAWNLWFYLGKIKITNSPHWIGLSIRLVKRKTA